MRAKYDELKVLINEVSPIVISLQETMLDDSTPCPRDYTYYRTNYDANIGSHGGSLIYVRRDIPHAFIPLNSPLQVIAVQINLSRKYTVCSIYLPPNEAFPRDDFLDLLHQLEGPFLVMGDMNGRHPIWGDSISNARGNILSSVIENEDISILNSGDPTHYHIQTGSLSCIDLTLCSSNCAVDFTWQVLNDLHGSDHFPIVVNSIDSSPMPSPPRWCLEKADWQNFKTLSEVSENVDDLPNTDRGIEIINDKLISAGFESIPRTTGIFKRRPVPWWSDTIKELHRATRRLLTRLRRHRTDENLIAYKKSRALLRRTIKEAKRQSWSKFVSSINSKTPVTIVWKKVRKISGKFVPNPPPALNVNGVLTTDPVVVSNTLADHFEKISRKSDESPGYASRLREEQRNLNFKATRAESYNLPFTEEEFDSALSSCNDSSPGPDEIPYAMLKHIPVNTKRFIVQLFSRIWTDNDFPSSWENATILPFAKPGKDSTKPTNYRPIALTNCLCKLMEKMVNTRLMWYLERNSMLSPYQCGFRKMHSTTDTLIRLETSICEAFASKNHHLTVFFDLEKAYDTTWRFGILKKIHSCGLRGELPLFIKSFLESRYFRVRVGNILSEKKIQEEGVPQGSVLSVTLFALAINDITNVVPPGILTTLFVDDLSLSFSAARMSVAERRLQLGIDNVVKWAESNGFKFSTSKTVGMHFCKIRKFHLDPDLYMNGQRIPCVDETRFLGLIFDRKLTWVPHFKFIRNKCFKSLQLLKILSHTSWGADRKTLLRLHHSLILSKLFYGCEVFTSASPSKLKMLDAVHHAGVRIATGAFKSSPISSLLADAGELPLDLLLQSSLVRCFYRLQRLPDSLTMGTIKNCQFLNFYKDHPKSPKPLVLELKSF